MGLELNPKSGKSLHNTTNQHYKNSTPQTFPVEFPGYDTAQFF